MGTLPPAARRKIGHLADIRPAPAGAPAYSRVMSADHAPPTYLTGFVGRTAETADLAAALAAPDVRLLTLAGPGGCGKTRLAAHAAAPDPDAHWVDLTATTSPAAVPALVAGALGVRLTDRDPVASLARQLADRRVLLCLDNCEHVLTAAADLVAAVLRTCRGATVLATSREPLGIPGERVWRVPPLSRDDAVALFHARAGGPPGSAAAAAAVRTACARLDGMPLGVELAAAWSGTLTPQEIVAGLDDRFRLLIRGPHGVAARHQTLAASLDWSHDLLDEPDRVLFRRLAVFRGGFTATAARGVAGPDVLTGLRRLVDKSLLTADTRGETTRYRLPETVREYAEARLDASGERDETRDRHLDTCLAAVEDAAHLLDADKDTWHALVEVDHENHRAAVEHGLTDDRGRRLAAHLAWFWHSSRRGAEGLDLLRRAVRAHPDDRTASRARLLAGLALVADTTRSTPEDRAAARTALDIADEVGDHRTACLARQLAALDLLGRDFTRAGALAAEAHEIATAADYGFGRDGADALTGILHHLRDRHAEAVPLLTRATAGLVARGDRGVAATALGFLATSAAATGDLRAARAFAERAVRVAAPLADFHRVGSAHAVLALVEGTTGRLDEAWAVLTPVLRLVEDAPAPPFVPGLVECAGRLHLWAGEPERALRAYRHEMSARPLTPHARIGLATALHRTGDTTAARREAAEVLDLVRDLGMPGLHADALHLRAELADPGEREDLHHRALAIRAEHGLAPACVHSLEALAHPAAGTTAARLLGACDRARQDMGLPRPDAGRDDDAFTEGRALRLDEAIAWIRRSRGTRSRPSSGWDSLTPAERSVVDLAVAGLTNPDIGKRLFMSRATVKTHLSHVYAKLGVANRTELATAARRHA
ncbi:helix-turn-helix transcriptional regulator [Saccharothrix syringae]|uniref:LuxR family transcriptional regulator n=1 Tax=Saccharothrix syringae TaxID=103733 RepID=A0A5Q0H725_SACSY|nr:LuxR C-terminal-related transcriptional regulator [Saccharothrix syringae]QFZ22001.1 LuxR family transcriptional regulator [Saccharothrix syringae]